MNTAGPYLLSKVSYYLLAAFFVIAGINHFLNPHFYYGLIPDYLILKEEINFLSGLAEIFLGMAVFNRKSRKLAAYGIMALLVVFIPSHIYFIQIGSCISDGLCVPAWLAWLRLILIHPLLIYWAYKVSKIKN